MSTFTFEDYCEEFLDQHVALMSREQQEEAYKGFTQKSKPAKKPAVNPLEKMTIKVLSQQLSLTVEMMQNQIKFSKKTVDAPAVEIFCSSAAEFLNATGRKKKADLIALIEESEIAKKELNAARAK